MMHYAVTIVAGTLVWTSLLSCQLASATSQQSTTTSQEDSASLQMDGSSDQNMDKRDWSSLHGGWGKRAWQDMPTGWGKRAWKDMQGAWGKRAWQDMSSGWGKRAWKDMQGAWGKRDDSSDKRAWQKLQASWGKRWIPEDEFADQELKNLANLLDSVERDQQYEDLNGASPSLFEDFKRSLNAPWRERIIDTCPPCSCDRDPSRPVEKKAQWSNLKQIWG